MKMSMRSKLQGADMLDAIKMLGFEYLEMNFFRRIEDINQNSQLILYCELREDDTVNFTAYKDALKVAAKSFTDAVELIDYVESFLKSYGIAEIKLVPLDSSTYIPGVSIIAKTTSSKDFADKLARVKSSNVWSYAFNPRDEYSGDLLMQFKGSNGGPGDIYIYYEVPSKIWRRFVASPSKGHFFWQNIRNVFKYAKLTGDKRTKLPNGL